MVRFARREGPRVCLPSSNQSNNKTLTEKLFILKVSFFYLFYLFVLTSMIGCDVNSQNTSGFADAVTIAGQR